MARKLDLDDLFKTLDKGFDGMEKGITDRSIRLDQRMEKMRQKIEERADVVRERVEKRAESIRRSVDKMGQIKTRGKSRIVIDGEDMSDSGIHPAVQMFKIFLGSLKWFLVIILCFYIFATFNNFMDKLDDKVPALNPTTEETVKDSSEKL